MELRIITLADLEDLTTADALKKVEWIPITPMRARSQQKNPQAQPQDSVLILAYNDAQELIAFFGCLPDRLQNEDGLSQPVCWSTGWWVHPHKGRSAAMPVFYKALQLWETRMLFDALPERSMAILEKMKYFSFRKIKGQHIFLLFKFHKIIPRRLPVLAPLKNIFLAVDIFFNLPLKMWQRIKGKQFLSEKNIQIQRIEYIDKATETFIHEIAKNELSPKSADTFNWIIKYPWLSSEQDFSSRYYFSSFARNFENILLNIYENEKQVAFLWMTLRDGTAKLPYCYIKSGKEKIAVKVLIQQLLEKEADTFICFQQNILPEIMQQNIPMLYSKEISKTFAWTKTLDNFFEKEIYIQDGDGDGVFT